MRTFIEDEIQKTRTTLAAMLADQGLITHVEAAAQQCVHALKQGHKIMFAGNGGSAADSQHLAAELVNRFRYNRPGLAGIALTTDTSTLTSIGNDHSFENLFARQVEAIGQQGDVLFGISTSGKSPNILCALEKARKMGIITIGFTGKDGGLMADLCHVLIKIPNTETGKIQECHMIIGHIICSLIEEDIFGKLYNPEHMLDATQ